MITEDEKNQMKKEIINELCEYIPGLRTRIEFRKMGDDLPIGETITIKDGFGACTWKKEANDKWSLMSSTHEE